MFLQAMETATTSFWSASGIYLLWWLGTFLLASALYWFGYGKKYRDQLEDSGKTIRTLKPQIEVLSNKQEHLTSEKTQLKKNLEELLNKHNSLKAYHDNVQAKYQTANKQFEQSNEERQSLLESYESLEKNLEVAEQNYNDSLTKIDKLENELENQMDQSDDTGPLLKEIQRLEDLLAEKEREVGGLQLSLASASVPAQGLGFVDNQGEQEALEKEITKISSEKASLQSTYTSLQKEYNQLRNQHTTLANNFQSLELKNKQLSKSVKTLEYTLNSSDNKTSTALNISSAPITKDLVALQTKYAQLEGQHQELTKTKYQLQNELSKLNGEFLELKSTNENLKGRFELLSEQQKETVSTRKELQLTILQLEKLQAEKKGSLSQIELMLEELRKENTILKDKNIELELAKNQFNQKYLAAKQSSTKVHPQLKQQALQLARSEHRSELQQLKLKLQQQGTELVNTQARLKQFLEMKASNLTLDSNNKTLSTAYSNLQKKHDSFYKEYLNIKSQFQLLRDKYEHLDNTSANISEQRLKLDKNNTNLSTELNQLRVQNNQLLSEKADLAKQIQEMERYLSAPKQRNIKSSRATRVIQNGQTIAEGVDDLKIIEGIGPIVEKLLRDSGIYNWKKLSHTGIGELKRLLTKGNHTTYNPSTWPEQAGLAAAEKWEELKKLQNELINGERK